MDERRTLRVSEAVKEELAELVGFEMDDPRLATVGVTEASVSPDARYAHIKGPPAATNESGATPWRPWSTPATICGANWPPAWP